MIKTLIIEDETLAAEMLSDMLHEIDPEIEVLAIIGNIKDSIKWLQNNEADLIFLDIKLEDGLSFEIFDQVQVDSPVIFTTAYDKYAINAFKLNSIDYILKPIAKEALQNSLIKLKKLGSGNKVDIESLRKIFKNDTAHYTRSFLINIGAKIIKADVKDINYFYAYDKAVYAVTSGKKEYLLDHSLDKLEEMLDPAQFFRINRQFLIAERAITSMYAYSRGRVKLDLFPEAPHKLEALVSIEKSSTFKEWLTEN